MAESLSAAFFQNNPDLRGQILTGVERTGQELGRGSYGTVEVVSLKYSTLQFSSLSSFLGDLWVPHPNRGGEGIPA